MLHVIGTSRPARFQRRTTRSSVEKALFQLLASPAADGLLKTPEEALNRARF